MQAQDVAVVWMQAALPRWIGYWCWYAAPRTEKTTRILRVQMFICSFSFVYEIHCCTRRQPASTDSALSNPQRKRGALRDSDILLFVCLCLSVCSSVVWNTSAYCKTGVSRAGRFANLAFGRNSRKFPAVNICLYCITLVHPVQLGTFSSTVLSISQS